MKHLIIFFVCIALLVSVVGCQSMGKKAKTGTLVGALGGAGLGGIIGHQSGHGAEGAAIGGAVGALTGGLIGNQMDKNAQQTQSASYSATVTTSQGMTLQEIVDLVGKGVHEDVIIDRIRLANTRLNLSETDITYLRDNGVSEKVISELRTRGL